MSLQGSVLVSQSDDACSPLHCPFPQLLHCRQTENGTRAVPWFTSSTYYDGTHRAGGHSALITRTANAHVVRDTIHSGGVTILPGDKSPSPRFTRLQNASQSDWSVPCGPHSLSVAQPVFTEESMSVVSSRPTVAPSVKGRVNARRLCRLAQLASISTQNIILCFTYCT